MGHVILHARHSSVLMWGLVSGLQDVQTSGTHAVYIVRVEYLYNACSLWPTWRILTRHEQCWIRNLRASGLQVLYAKRSKVRPP